MGQIITATFEEGVLKPDQVLELAPHSRVRLTVEPIDAPDEVASRLGSAFKSFGLPRRRGQRSHC
jgi:predicted DNA-binding antitoxin AbrB/MazE fold protein